MSKIKLEDYAEIAFGAYILGEFLNTFKLGPSKKELQEQKKAAIRKRNKATRVYWQAGKKWADYYDPRCNVGWKEEIKHDPFHLYGGGTDD